MKKHVLLVIVFYLHCFKAQDSLQISTYKKSVESHLKYKRFIIPAGLVAAGSLLKIPSIEDNLQKNQKKIFGENFHTRVDDYTQYLPVVGIFSGHILGFKSEHTYTEMAANVAVSSLITGGIVTIAKNGFSAIRPDNSAQNSFPSGHSALAFNLATIQFLEYRNSNIWYASSGLLIATATALMRVANNRHWTGDILAGSGIGMAVAIIIDYMNPLLKLNFMKKLSSKELSLIGYPVMEKNSYGIGVLIRINR